LLLIIHVGGLEDKDIRKYLCQLNGFHLASFLKVSGHKSDLMVKSSLHRVVEVDEISVAAYIEE
jgi:hypothetical protein